ncbi:4-hydroxy-tetrahydrodipicolinate synthase [Rubritalea squalenifaciens DSM 18772]|uniref:4-hydroxy-tetrahydrodipicolinate synthase n=1 Tax=Rubritalea squalenifaciens DSM 18772 TaxID=1123071 RepID=A0A1M6EDD8_9BACT|nr:4-hydroxy-tetrahydrodipicolinate synthase [Rubritalea squalenifaciens]SHI83338.1 4-hydroxy-tetrahydrodipicolinate synthase [Rubritalea squalenifaciens DSM 18772]
MFAGTHTAIITPFRDGQVDEEAFRQLIEKQIEAGVEGIVPVGTTGESPTLDPEEHLEVIRIAVDAVKGRIKVIAGTGANSTSEAIELTEAAEKLGVDGSLQVTPYYNKPSQEGLYRHFKAVAESTTLPIMLYSVPGRSVVEIAPETAGRLAADCDNIVAIKEAGGKVERVDELKAALPEGFEILSGDDPITLEMMKRGACGAVSVASNIIPGPVSEMIRAMNAGDVAKAEELQEKYSCLLNDLMAIDTNPVPVKAAAALMGYCTEEIRLPMVALEGDKLEQVRVLLSDYNLI